VVVTNNEILFTPTNGFSGTAVIPYQVCDQDNECSTAILVLNIHPHIPQAPMAENDSAGTSEDTLVIINMIDNDTDPDNNLIS
jgi:hypothetical protein